MARSKLTPKQEKFVQEYHCQGNQREAYKAAYAASNMSDKAIDNEAYLLMQNPEIALRLKELQERVAKKTEVTVATISDMLTEAFDKGKADPKGASAMVAAAMGKAKLHGLIVSKSEDVTANRSTDKIDARIRQLLEQRDEGTAADTAGRARESQPAGEVVPTVPGHGTA